MIVKSAKIQYPLKLRNINNNNNNNNNIVIDKGLKVWDGDIRLL